MGDFTLNGNTLCELVESICADKHIGHIKIKGYGTSMSPFLKSGSTLFIKPSNGENTIKAGDIVAAIDTNREKIIVHRVILLKNGLLQIKGDNCSKDDGWFQKTRILGIVTAVKTASGKKKYYKRWQNLTIAFLSKTGFLNRVLLPLARFIKKKIKK
ncbi:MAG: S24/S26 family peptidase [Desulfobacula sp.]|jgi:signal peptidase I|nr:S24/S26 family peptidase [Desulfobacula sp.]